MARPYTAKVNHHVIYYGINCRPRPGIITAVTSNTVVDIRVGHAGETHAATVRSLTKAVNSWRPA